MLYFPLTTAMAAKKRSWVLAEHWIGNRARENEGTTRGQRIRLGLERLHEEVTKPPEKGKSVVGNRREGRGQRWGGKKEVKNDVESERCLSPAKKNTPGRKERTHFKGS